MYISDIPHAVEEVYGNIPRGPQARGVYSHISHTAWEVKKRCMGVYLAYKPTHSTTGQYIAESGVLYMISG